MSKIRRVLHDAWCGLTERCTFTPRVVRTPMIDWLKEQEEYANQSAENIRRRREVRDLSFYMGPRKKDTPDE